MKSLGRILLVSFFLFATLFNSIAQKISTDISQQETKAIKKTVKDWSRAHEDWDFATLKDLYADSVLFYTKKLPAGTVLSKITAMLNPNKAFKHRIASEIKLKRLPDGEVKCDFTKEVTVKGKNNLYPSYIVLSKVNDRYLVTVESDYITDKNLHYNFDEDAFNSSFQKRSKVIKSNGNGGWFYVFIVGCIGAIVVYLVIRRKKQISKKSTKSVSPTVIESQNTNLSEKASVPSEDPNKKKGDEFETYIMSKFDPAYFKSLDWRGDKFAHGHFPESNMNPDMEFMFRYNGYEAQFAVECKYRSNFSSGYVEIADYKKMERYREFEKRKQIHVYIVIGVGGKPSDPDQLYLIPLPHIKNNKMHKDELQSNYFKSINSNFFYDRGIHQLT